MIIHLFWTWNQKTWPEFELKHQLFGFHNPQDASPVLILIHLASGGCCVGSEALNAGHGSWNTKKGGFSIAMFDYRGLRFPDIQYSFLIFFLV